MSQRELGRAIGKIRNEVVEEAVLRDAAKRVFASVFDSTLRPEQVGRIKGCADFRLLMTAYVSHTLSPARALLLEDHTRECVPCRKALQEARTGPRAGQVFETGQAVQSNKRFPALAWALAVALAIGVGIGVVGSRYGLLPGQHAVQASVAAVDGSLYRITEFGARLVAVGEVVRNADELRTAKGSRAILRLVGGALLELAERSDVSINGSWKGAAVTLEQGRLIVESRASQSKTYVSSGDLVIPVKEAIFAVDSGVQGSRVAVAKGIVQVQQGRQATDVSAGQQFASNHRIGLVPIAAQFAWSQNANSYAALLNEFASLRKQFQSIPSPGLRYSSNLAQYAPDNTVIYAAIPNLGGTLTEVKRLFDERLSQSEVLREWWNQQPASKTADLDRALTQLASVSQYLGDELVVAVPSTGAHQYGPPVFVAERRQSGLNDYLLQNVPSSTGLRIVTDTSSVDTAGKGQLFVEADTNIVVASPDLAELQTVEAAIRGTAASAFVQTPFYRRIARSYSAGVQYLLAADMEQIGARSVSTPREPLAGFSNVQYLVLDRRDTDGNTETRAALSFAGSRQGIASWLGSPGPIGSIGFVSPEASLAVAVVMKNPRDMATELITFASQGNPQFLEQLRSFESGAGVSLLDDVAAPLGGDAAFAIDGPLLPVPAWKLVVEVNDTNRLQNTLTALVSRYNQTPASTSGKLQLRSDQVGSRMFYSVRSEKAPEVAAYYTFVDGYLLASASEAALSQAIEDRQTGHTLVSSSAFRNELPADNSTNFSAILYNNLGPALGPIASQLKGSSVLTPAQRQSVTALAASAAPGLICLYGEPDGIVAVTRSSFLGFNLGTLAGIQQGKPLVPLIAGRALAMRSEVADRSRQSRN
jgi:hypothetical protein